MAGGPNEGEEEEEEEEEGRHKMGNDQERICLILKAEKEEVEHSKHNALLSSAQLNSHYGNFIDPILPPPRGVTYTRFMQGKTH